MYRLSDDLAIVQTVDYFTPIVDDPGDWGRIAAANALSDVYAMGAKPLTALSIVGWPREELSIDMLGDVLEGGAAKLAEAGTTLVGGHSIDDREPKYGLAVTGVVHPEHIVTNAGAKAGDRLVLTKPLGTGIIATAIKRELASKAMTATAVGVMETLNRGAADAMRRIGVVAATDVTGYGLLGHLGEMLRASGVSAELELAAVPVIDGVRDLIADGVVPGGTRRNLTSAARFSGLGALAEVDQVVLSDAQTSGGLLIAVDAPLAAALLQALREEDVVGHEIGTVVERRFEDGPGSYVRIR